jgi:hypothetical protein
MAELAAVLGAERSTATRMCDRLVRKRLIHRRRESRDRNAVQVALSADGRKRMATRQHSGRGHPRPRDQRRSPGPGGTSRRASDSPSAQVGR